MFTIYKTQNPEIRKGNVIAYGKIKVKIMEIGNTHQRSVNSESKIELKVKKEA